MMLFASKLFEYFALSGLVVTSLAAGNVIYNLYFHPLRKYPGPKLWAATRLTWSWAMQCGEYHHLLRTLHDEYGPVVRIAPDELSFTDARAWKDIYGNRKITKNRVWAGQEEEHRPISLLSTDEATHLRNRRALTGAFSEHAITEHAAVLEGFIGLMMQKFENAITTGQGRTVVDLTDWLSFLIFDISATLSFGQSFDSVKNGVAHPWVEISCSFGKGIALMASINFYRPLENLLKFAMPKSALKKMEYHKQLVHEKLQQRLEREHKSNIQDYVGSVMTYNEEKGEVKIPKDEIESNLRILIFAGSETSSTAMTAILTYLLQNPKAYANVHEEVRDAFRDARDITTASVGHLEYLTAAIQEGLRLAPSAPVGVPRVTSKEGAEILGQFVPGKTFVSINQYPTFRSASNFTQPDSFIPERFLPDPPFESDRLDAFEPFLVGRHHCIGQKLAMAMMRLTLARLLYSFEVKAIGELRDFGAQKTYIFWEKKPLKVELRLRV